MIKMKHVDGKNKGEIILYALSTCGWCHKMKDLLNSLGVSYDYVDADFLNEKDVAEVEAQVERWNPKGTYPTIVIDKNRCIINYDEEKIRKELGG